MTRKGRSIDDTAADEGGGSVIYVARHGQTEWNALNKVLGRTDIPLDPTGIEQARVLASSIKELCVKGLEIDAFLCSPLSRARQTADAISEETGLRYRVDDRLIEQDFGQLEGVDRFAAEFQDAKREFFARYPGGESYFDIAARVYPLLEELDGKNALLVTHGGICRVIRSYFEDLGNEEFVQFSQGNCELAKYI